MPVQTEPHNSTSVDQPRLWFGFAAGAAAWLGLFIIDLLLAWKMCTELPNGVDVVSLGWLLYLMAAVTVAMLAITIAAGLISLRNFRRVSNHASLASTEAAGREEFMAVGGVFISVLLGIGIIWLGIPLIILNICTRAR